MLGYEVRTAQKGGYWVRSCGGNKVLFAGTLDECLAFIRKAMLDDEAEV